MLVQLRDNLQSNRSTRVLERARDSDRCREQTPGAADVARQVKVRVVENVVLLPPPNSSFAARWRVEAPVQIYLSVLVERGERPLYSALHFRTGSEC